MYIISPICGFISLALGIIVLFGWYTHSTTLIQVHASFVPMQYNTALGFLMCGAGLLSTWFSKSKAAKVSGFLLVLLGGLTLIEYIFGVDLSIDQLFMEHYVGVKTSHPGRMAPNTALCFLLVGISILIAANHLKKSAKVLGFLGALIFALGTVPFFGYFAGVETAYGWGNLTRMAVHTSLGFIVLGVGLVVYAWKSEIGDQKKIPVWLPILVGVAAINTTVLLWQAVSKDINQNRYNLVLQKGDQVKKEVLSELEGRINGLKRIVRRWKVMGPPSQKEWQSDSSIYVEHHLSMIRIGYINPDFKTTWIAPLKGNEDRLGKDHSLDKGFNRGLSKSRDEKSLMISRIFDTEKDKNIFGAVLPIYHAGEFQGFIAGVFKIEKLIQSLLQEGLAEGVNIEFLNKSASEASAEMKKLQQKIIIPLQFYDHSWSIVIEADPDWIESHSSVIPMVVLFFGIFVSLILTGAVHLALRARFSANETFKANEALRETKKKMEKTNELLLEGAVEGIYGLDLEGNTTFVNPAGAEMLGYASDELLGKPQHPLVHHTKANGEPYPREECHIYAAFRDGKVHYEENEVFWKKDGTSFPVEYTSRPIRERSKITGAVVTFSDITRRKETEEALKENEDQFRSLVDNIPGVSYRCLIDKDWTMLYISDAVQELTGYPPSDYIRNSVRTFDSVSHPDDKEMIAKAVEECVKEKKTFTIEYRIIHSDGRILWVTEKGQASFDEKGDPLYLDGAIFDITERKEAENKLIQAREAAEAANEAKSMFISSMSHEIRTPMNAILGYSQILERDKELNSKQKKGVESIHRAGKHLLDIINDILDFSKIEAGKMEIHPSDFDLGSLVQDLIVLFSEKCKEKKLDLLTEGVQEGQKINVHADAAKMRQVLINLMGNAVKFTDSGKVSLRLMPLAGDEFYFEVKDTGQGIPKEKLESIFESFQQDEEGIKKGGTGLGLAIARKIVSAMGGDLQVESEAGKGSRFFFTISLPAAKGEVDAIDDRLTHVIGLASGHSVKAVLIDDIRGDLNVLNETFKELGVETITADSGPQGLEKIREAKPDIIFVDYNMPGMDGLEVTRKVKEEYGEDSIKVVIISASTFTHNQEKYKKEGVHGFISKPFIREEILGTMARLLNVEYEYDEGTLSTGTHADIDFSTIKLPAQLHASIKKMADMGMMTELEEIMPQIESSGPDGPALAAHIKERLEQFDTDGIINILAQMDNE